MVKGVYYVNKDIKELITCVILIVEMDLLLLMSNVTTAIQCLKMDVINVKEFALLLVQLVNKAFVMIVMKALLILNINALKFRIIIMIGDAMIPV